MKLQDVLDVISGGTKIVIYAGVHTHIPLYFLEKCVK
jgi:hypothetical protein